MNWLVNEVTAGRVGSNDVSVKGDVVEGHEGRNLGFGRDVAIDNVRKKGAPRPASSNGNVIDVVIASMVQVVM